MSEIMPSRMVFAPCARVLPMLDAIAVTKAAPALKAERRVTVMGFSPLFCVSVPGVSRWAWARASPAPARVPRARGQSGAHPACKARRP